MRLNLDSKTKKNFKLLQSCTKVRIIELTEKIMQLEKKQLKLIGNSDNLQTFLEGLFDEQHHNDNVVLINPTPENLTGVALPNPNEFTPDTEFEKEYRDYHSVVSRLDVLRRSLDEFKDLDTLLSGRDPEQPNQNLRRISKPLNAPKINSFLDNKHHTGIFKKFAHYVKTEPAIALSLKFKIRANKVAERNGIANSAFYTNTDQAFYAKDVAFSLNKDFKGRAINTGAKMLAGLALSATLYGVGFSHGRNDVTTTQGITDPHTSSEATTSETPAIDEMTDIVIENPSIFRNSVPVIDSYETACQDYFEAISDIYAHNTGESIDLSGYSQENIGLNNSTRLLIVHNNGKTYTFSAQSPYASNFTYLKKALDAAGMDYEEDSSLITYLVDEDNSSQSIAIADSAGNPVRSGNVLSGNNQAYNPDYVQKGREILVAQGKTANTLSEAECVGAYLISDQYTIQNDELSRALGEVTELTEFIKNHFYYRDGASDPYTVDLYKKKAATFEEKYESQISNSSSTYIFLRNSSSTQNKDDDREL